MSTSERADLIAKLLRLANDPSATPAEAKLAREKALQMITGRLGTETP
jgi:hypothetical protein